MARKKSKSKPTRKRARATPTSTTKAAPSPRELKICDVLHAHFGKYQPADLSVSERAFPIRVRADLQRIVQTVIESDPSVKFFCGVQSRSPYEPVEFNQLLVKDRHYPPIAVPPQYDEVDIGEIEPVRCLKIGLWIIGERDER